MKPYKIAFLTTGADGRKHWQTVKDSKGRTLRGNTASWAASIMAAVFKNKWPWLAPGTQLHAVRMYENGAIVLDAPFDTITYKAH